MIDRLILYGDAITASIHSSLLTWYHCFYANFLKATDLSKAMTHACSLRSIVRFFGRMSVTEWRSEDFPQYFLAVGCILSYISFHFARKIREMNRKVQTVRFPPNLLLSSRKMDLIQ
jgi:hypothetical protein